jgi:hypothetical protein
MKIKVYLDPNDIWVGVYRGESHWYVLPLPFWVIRIPRRCGRRGNATVAMAKCTEHRGHELPHRNRRYGFAWHDHSW